MSWQGRSGQLPLYICQVLVRVKLAKWCCALSLLPQELQRKQGLGRDTESLHSKPIKLLTTFLYTQSRVWLYLTHPSDIYMLIISEECQNNEKLGIVPPSVDH